MRLDRGARTCLTLLAPLTARAFPLLHADHIGSRFLHRFMHHQRLVPVDRFMLSARLAPFPRFLRDIRLALSPRFTLDRRLRARHSFHAINSARAPVTLRAARSARAQDTIQAFVSARARLPLLARMTAGNLYSAACARPKYASENPGKNSSAFGTGSTCACPRIAIANGFGGDAPYACQNQRACKCDRKILAT